MQKYHVNTGFRELVKINNPMSLSLPYKVGANFIKQSSTYITVVIRIVAQVGDSSENARGRD